MPARTPIKKRRVGENKAARVTSLLDRALQGCHEAASAVDPRKSGARSRALGEVLDIVDQLADMLDHGVAPDLCGQLDYLYFYAKERVQRARKSRIKFSNATLADAVTVLTVVRHAFIEALESTSKSQPEMACDDGYTLKQLRT